MSKKIASGAEIIVIDLKVGKGAFMKDLKSATKLAKTMIKIGKQWKKKVVVILSDMNSPLGNNIGNALEIKEVIDFFEGKREKRLERLALVISSYMIMLGKNISYSEAYKLALNSLKNNKAKEIFNAWINYQGGNLNELKENDNLEETVIVIANDHHPYGLAPTWAGNDNTDYLSELYGKKAISLADKEKGVFIIYNTKQTPENVTVPVCSFDVMPTLLNMFGIEFDSRLLCGKDAFTPGERLIPFSDGSFVSEKGYFNPRTHNIGDQNYVDEIKNKILLQKRYSLSARKNGYFSYLSR